MSMWYLFWHYLIGSRQNKFMHGLFGFSLMFPTQKPQKNMAYFAIHFPHQTPHFVSEEMICINPLPGLLWPSAHNGSPVEVGSFSRYLQGFIRPRWLFLGFLPPTVPLNSLNHLCFFWRCVICVLAGGRSHRRGWNMLETKMDGKTIGLLPECGQKGRLTWRDVYCCSPS